MQPRQATFVGIVTRLFCAIALLSLSLVAPAEANSRALSSEEVAAFMLPDGSLPSLCVTIPDGSGQGKIVKLGADSFGLHHHDVILRFPPKRRGRVSSLLPNGLIRYGRMRFAISSIRRVRARALHR